MAVERRRFLRMLVGTIVAGPTLWAAERVAPVRWTEALRARLYPGPVNPIDLAAVRRPGKWAG